MRKQKQEEEEEGRRREGEIETERHPTEQATGGYESKKGTQTTSTVKFPKAPAMCCFLFEQIS